MRKRLLSKIPLFLPFLAAALLSACSGKSSSVSYSETSGAAADYGEAYAPEVSAAGMQREEAKSAADSADGSALTSESSGTAANVLPAGRKLIRNISMDVETDAYETLITSLQEKVSELGGYIEQSDMSGGSQNSYRHPPSKYASITARIPSDKVDGFITAVEGSGNVISKSESTQDITLQYSDLESRKKSLEIEQDKLWEFLGNAESVDTVITLQQRLTEVRYQLESMESQLRLFDNQVDYSEVHLTVSEVTTFTPVAPESALTRINKGLSRNFKALKTGTENFLIALIIGVPLWLPLVLIAGIVVFFVKKGRKKKKAGISKPEPVKEEKEQKES